VWMLQKQMYEEIIKEDEKVKVVERVKNNI
jgi:hypothetical protein